MDISILRKRIARLKTEREQLEGKLLHTKDAMVDCSLIKRYVQCSKPGCRCQRGKDKWHGPFYYASRKVSGKTAYRYVSKGKWYETSLRANSYKKYQRRLSGVRQINREIDVTFNDIRGHLIKLGKKKK